MYIKCNKCSDKVKLDNMKIKSISEGEEFSEEDWFLDLQFKEKDNLIIKDYYALCPECRDNKYKKEMKNNI